MNIEIVDITPDYAKELLKLNTNNRPVRGGHVKFLSAIMTRGEFQFNGDAIRISESNVILDGQHRLLAIIKSGITLKVVVIRGLQNSAFKTIDVDGMKRTSGQVLGLNNIKNYNGVASATRLYFLLKQNGDPFNTTNSPSATQILNMADSNPLIAECVSTITGMAWIKKYLKLSIGSFLLAVFAEKNKEKAFEFFNMLDSGASLCSDNPIYLLRERIISDSATVGSKIDQTYIVKLAFKTFNYYLTNKKIKCLKLVAGEKFVYVL